MSGIEQAAAEMDKFAPGGTLAKLRAIKFAVLALEFEMKEESDALAVEFSGTNDPVNMATAAAKIKTLRDLLGTAAMRAKGGDDRIAKREEAYGAMLAAAGVPIIEGNLDQSAVAEILRLKTEVADLMVEAVRTLHNHSAALRVARFSPKSDETEFEIPDGVTLEHNAIEAACVLNSGKREDIARYLRRRSWRQLAQHEWADPQNESGTMLMESAKNIQIGRDLAPFGYFLQRERDGASPFPEPVKHNPLTITSESIAKAFEINTQPDNADESVAESHAGEGLRLMVAED